MEKFKKSVEIARDSCLSVCVDDSRDGKAAINGPARNATPSSGSISGLNVNYTRTRQFTLSEQTIKRNRIVTGRDADPAINAFKLLRTQVLQRCKVNNWNAVAITSPGENEGKTLTAVNFSITLAREVNHTVLLVDLDLKNPSLAACLGHEPEYGLHDYLLDDVPLENILVNPGVDRLVVLPGRGSLDNSSEMLSSPKMVNLVNELKARYPERFIVFDLPSLLETDDALAFSPYIDAALLVVEEGRTSGRDLARASEMLESVNVIGTVLNKSAER
jgi:Mrp family chromosome partitioning ATPase